VARAVYAGALHYWRLEPDAWAPCLRAMHDAGFTHVETPVPWRVHEPARGQLQWTGERDLVRFVELARAAGLGVVVRLGPIAGAELTSFGIPDWVLAEPACRAVTSRGTPAWLPAPPRAFPIPSLASASFRAHVRAWFENVGKLVPKAAISAIALEHPGAQLVRTGAYDVDYHPDALAWFAEIAGVGATVPRAWSREHAAACVRWVQFRGEYADRAHREWSAMLDDAGLGEVARIDLAPVSYAARSALRDVHVPAGSVAQCGVGLVPWLPPDELAAADGAPHAERDRLIASLVAARGFDLVMAVERDRYCGGAIDRQGRVQAAWLRPLLAALAEVDWPSLRRATPIALVDVRADWRFGIASCFVDPVPDVLAELLALGPGGAAELGDDAGAVAARRWHVAVRRALELAQVPYAIVDEHTPADELAGYRAVIAPTLERIDRGLWQTLRELADAKRTIVVIGPGTPVRDEFDRPLDGPLGGTAPRRMGRLEPGSLDDLAGLAAALGELAGELPDAWQVERPNSVRSAVFSDDAGAPRIVLVLADGSAPIAATLLADPSCTRVRDVLTGELVPVRDGRVALTVAGARVLLPET
jgi:beta-galactosidase